MSSYGKEGAELPVNQPNPFKNDSEGKKINQQEKIEQGKETPANYLSEIEDLRCERLPELSDRQVTHKRLLKVIILGDTGESDFYLILNSYRYW